MPSFSLFDTRAFRTSSHLEKDIVRGRYESRAILDQAIASGLAIRGEGDRSDVLSHLRGESHGDHRPAARLGFGHDDHAAEARNDSIASRKVLGGRLGAQRVFRKHEPVFLDPFLQICVLRGIIPVHAIAKDRDRLTIGKSGL